MYVLFFCFFFVFWNSRSFIYLYRLCWVFVSVRGLSLVAASGDHSSSRCADLSPSRPLLLRSTGSRCAGSVIVAHGLSCSVACGILPDQGSNPCPLHWQADSQPLRHQGSPWTRFLKKFLATLIALILLYICKALFQTLLHRMWELKKSSKAESKYKAKVPQLAGTSASSLPSFMNYLLCQVFATSWLAGWE